MAVNTVRIHDRAGICFGVRSLSICFLRPMVQTIIVFVLFFGFIAYKAYKFFHKDKSKGDLGDCAKCGFAKKVGENS